MMTHVYLDPQTLGERETYKLLIGCVVPRPIAWVSTVDQQGIRNLAPFSFFNGVGSSPPAVSISINYTDSVDQRKDTLRNIATTGEFVVNIVSEELAQAMNATATNYPPEIDEFEVAGLAAAPCVTVRAPRVAEAPVSLECKLFTLVPVGQGPGSATLVVGVVQMIHARDDIINDRNHVDIMKMRPIARLAGSGYAYVHETFEMPRPVFNKITGQVEPQQR
jgi:flavin reductase (DIM6/NTAB) family NADH-FMN oxidoreductase RutF